MKTRSVAVGLSRCRAILRRWLAFAWIGRLHLLVPCSWHNAATLPPSRVGELPAIFHPHLVYLERRGSLNGTLSAASAPLPIGGMVLLADSHTMPKLHLPERTSVQHSLPSENVAAPNNIAPHQ